MRLAAKAGLVPLVASALAAGMRADAVGLGAASCSASGCHGGAAEKSSQFHVWSERDPHAQAFGTLGTARSARMGEALGIAVPSSSPRCEVCHAPMSLASGTTPAPDPAEGVSCVSCHALPSGWIRSHTRPDLTHAERVAAGMRDLADLYTRANTCVACHQNIDPEIVRKGHHPGLIFEMDGQTQSEPRHWSDPAGIGAQAWFVGQAVALREISWSLLNGRSDAQLSGPAMQGIAWVLSRTGLAFGASLSRPADASPSGLAQMVEDADRLAKRGASAWKPGFGQEALARLAGAQSDFRDASTPQEVQACRAERLVLALDRLFASLPAARRTAASSAELDRLFRLAQSKPDFEPDAFADELSRFGDALGPFSGTARG